MKYKSNQSPTNSSRSISQASPRASLQWSLSHSGSKPTSWQRSGEGKVPSLPSSFRIHFALWRGSLCPRLQVEIAVPLRLSSGLMMAGSMSRSNLAICFHFHKKSTARWRTCRFYTSFSLLMLPPWAFRCLAVDYKCDLNLKYIQISLISFMTSLTIIHNILCNLLLAVLPTNPKIFSIFYRLTTQRVLPLLTQSYSKSVSGADYEQSNVLSHSPNTEDLDIRWNLGKREGQILLKIKSRMEIPVTMNMDNLQR